MNKIMKYVEFNNNQSSEADVINLDNAFFVLIL